jgi:hypothetical protein
MAIYHLSAQIISRSSGRTSVAASAYRSGSILVCERDGLTHDYSHRKDVVWSEIVLPEHAPKRWLDRSTLWNEVEATERSSRAQLCREINVALPRELTRDEQVALARRYAKAFAAEGMVVDWSIHDKDGANPHVHLMLSLRPSTSEGFGPKSANAYLVRNDAGEEREATAAELKQLGGEWQKVFKYKNGQQLTQQQAAALGLNPTKDRKSRAPVQSTRALTDWDSKEKLREWRKRWADMANVALEAHGSTERIDHRSNRERGVEFIPTIHEGPQVAAMERKAKQRAERKGRKYEPVTDRRRINLQIQAINEWIRRVVMKLTELMLTRAEHAKSKSGKDAARRNVNRARKPRRKKPYAPQRGRRVSYHGGMSK